LESIMNVGGENKRPPERLWRSERLANIRNVTVAHVKTATFAPEESNHVFTVLSPDSHDRKSSPLDLFHCYCCQEYILGDRFRCKLCEDFDICQDCKESNEHKHNDFKVIPKDTEYEKWIEVNSLNVWHWAWSSSESIVFSTWYHFHFTSNSLKFVETIKLSVFEFLS
jgi:hypothetical protein